LTFIYVFSSELEALVGVALLLGMTVREQKGGEDWHSEGDSRFGID
jgi:hypothetical protein